MSADFLTTLAARTLGLTPVIQPAIASLFAPQSNEEGRGQMADGRREDTFNIPDTTSSLSSPTLREATLRVSTSPLVPSGNFSEAISRLPYSQILATAPNPYLGAENEANKLSSSLNNSELVPENISHSPTQSQPSVLVQPIRENVANPVTQEQQLNTQIENTSINLEPNSLREQDNSEIIPSQINTVTSQPLSSAYSQLETEQNAMSNNKTHSVYAQPIDLSQQTEDGELGNANSQAMSGDKPFGFGSDAPSSLPLTLTQSTGTAKTATPSPLGVYAPLVEPLSDNVNLKLNIDSQNAIANPDKQLSFTDNQSNLIPQPTTQNIIQRQIDAATPLPSQSPTSPSLPLERSEYVTPILEPLINQINLQQQISNQQDFGSQSQEFSHNNEQSNFRQQSSEAEKFTSSMEISQSELTASQPSRVSANAVIPIVSPLQDDSIINTAQENTATSAPALNSSPSKASPPSVVPANAAIPVVSLLDKQQSFVSQQQDNSGTSEINPTVEAAQLQSATPAPSVVPANAVIPVVSPLDKQQSFVSQQQDNSGIYFAKEDIATPTPSVESSPSKASPLNKQQPFVSQRQDDSRTSAIFPAQVASNSAFETVESPTLQRTEDITPSSQRQIPQQTSQVSAAIPRPMTVTREQQSSATSVFSQQPQANRTVPTPTVVTPLVDKRRLSSADSSQAWEFQARLPSRNSTHENTAKVKPLVVVSQQRSPDLENNTQLNNGRETSAVLPPTVQVTIGRIEVRSSPTPTAPKTNNKSTPRQPSVSLQDYLKQRQGGKP